MFTKSAMWVFGVAALSSAMGFQLGSLTAAPPVPVAESRARATPQGSGRPVTRAVDVAELLAQLREDLGASLRRELGDELREALQEQFAQTFEASGQARPTQSAPAPERLTEEEREIRELAFEDASLVLENAQLRGRFDPESRDALHERLPELGPDDHYEFMRRISVALNEGAIEFEDPSEFPF